MIQCFAKDDFSSFFPINNPPKLLSISRTDSEFSRHSRMLHKHDDRLEIFYVHSGYGGYCIEEKCFDIQPGDFIICNSGILHDEVLSMNKKLSSYCLGVCNLNHPDLPENNIISNSISPVFSCGDYKDTIDQSLSLIFDMLTSKNKTLESACHHMMLSTLSIFYSIISEKISSDSYTEKNTDSLGLQIKKYIDEHYSESLTLENISNVFHINSYYMSHIFKDEIGFSPKQYVTRRRIGEAQSLLITSSQSITKISSNVGFGTPNHFNTQFLKYVGLSPSSFRKKYTLLE